MHAMTADPCCVDFIAPDENINFLFDLDFQLVACENHIDAMCDEKYI